MNFLTYSALGAARTLSLNRAVHPFLLSLLPISPRPTYRLLLPKLYIIMIYSNFFNRLCRFKGVSMNCPLSKLGDLEFPTPALAQFPYRLPSLL